MEKISLAIPTYNRDNFVIDAFMHVYDDDRIDEIIIVDDCSDENIYRNLFNSLLKYPKCKLYRNEKNLGAFLNKKKCVELSNNEWIILLDSDNSIKPNYLNALKECDNINTIYSPELLIGTVFDYREYSGQIYDKEKYIKQIKEGTGPFSAIFNTGNYYFYKNAYLDCINKEEKLMDNNPLSDVYYMVYLWIKNNENGKFKIQENLQYNHRTHSGSYWMTDPKKGGREITFLNNEIKQWKV